MNKEKLLEGLLSLIEKCVGDSEQENKQEAEVAIVKSVDKVEQRALFVVLSPSEADGTTTDLHGDWYSENDIASYNSFIISVNYDIFAISNSKKNLPSQIKIYGEIKGIIRLMD